MTTTLTVFDGWDLDVSEKDEPRARDIDIAKRAGLAQPRNVRAVIEKNWAELGAHGEIRVCTPDVQTSGGRPANEYWLNEDQSTALVALMRTPKARELRIALVRVFGAYRRGLLIQPTAPLLLDIAHGIRLRDEPRLKAEMRGLCAMTARASGHSLQAVYGFVRKTYRVGSPFDVAAAAWQAVSQTLQAIALGKLYLARPRRLLVADTRQVELPFKKPN